MKKLWYDWKEMRRDVNTLCRDIVLAKFDPDVIVGVSRGGLLPGVMMSHWMKKPFKPIKAALRDFPEWEDYLPRKTDKRVLIVDDVCDSGETFHKIRNYITGPRKGDPMEFNVMFDLRFCGGIMSVILNLIIMHRNVQRIQKISGFIFLGSIGGILLFNNLTRKELV